MNTRVLLVFAFVVLAPVFVAAQNQPSRTSNRQKTEQANQPTPVSVNCNCTTQADNGKDKPQGWHKLVTWPEGVATWALIFTLGAIVWQAIEVRRSVIVAMISAEAALQNARAVVNSERPWMIFELQPIPGVPKQGYVSFNAYNRGRTPARVISRQGDFFYRGRDNEVWEEEPVYRPIEDYHKTIISPGNFVHVYGFSLDSSLPHDNLEWMERNNKYLYFRGRIVYEDLITYERHESRFCYWLSPAPGIGLIMGGGSGWNKYT